MCVCVYVCVNISMCRGMCEWIEKSVPFVIIDKILYQTSSY